MHTNFTSRARTALMRRTVALLAISLVTAASVGAQTRAPADSDRMQLSRRAERPTRPGPPANFTGRK